MLRSRIDMAALVVLFLVTALTANAQELYPNTEPASIVPKNAIGVRMMNEAYNNAGHLRIWNGTMVMYGLSSKFMVSAMLTGSNHHGSQLSSSFIGQNAEQNKQVNPAPSSTRYPAYLSLSTAMPGITVCHLDTWSIPESTRVSIRQILTSTQNSWAKNTVNLKYSREQTWFTGVTIQASSE